METKKLNLSEGKKQKEEGIDKATVAMAGAGIAAAGVVGVKLFEGEDDEKVEDVNVTNETQTEAQQPVQEDVHEQPEPQQASSQPVAQTQQTNVQEPTPIAPDQPGTTGTQITGDITSTSTTTTTTTTVETEPLDPSEAEALAIAQHLVGEDEVDLSDIDAPSLAILDTDVMYDEDGNEIPVAQVSVPGDSETYILADIDGDRVYDYVIDSNGTIVDMVQSGLNVDDAELALSGEAGYLAVNDDSIQHISEEDILDDIMVLGTPEQLDYQQEEIHGEDVADLGYEDADPSLLVDDSDVMDDIITDIGYDAPDEG